MQSKIEQQVMAGVATIYMARKLVSATALKLYVCALSLYGLAQLVWVSRVFENFSAVGWGNALQFATSAILNTDFTVQLTFFAFMIAAVWLLVDLTRIPVSSRSRFA
jgi:hypothetical protein